MKRCQTEADRGEAARRSAVAAAIDDPVRELSPRFIVELVRVSSSPQSSLFGHAEAIGSAIEFGGRGTVLEQRVTEIFRRQRSRGFAGKEAVERAVAHALEERIEARIRQIEAHWRSKCNAPDANLLSREVRGALASISIEAISRDLVHGNDLRKLIPKKPTLNVNDDLGARP